MVVKVEVFTSDSCPHCPAAVNVANEAKAISLGIMAVPTIAINDEVVFVGAPVLDELVNKVKSLI